MLKKIRDKLVMTVQRVLMVVLLTVVYFIGFGVTLIFMMIFKRSALKGSNKNSGSFWVEAAGYNPDMPENLHQS